jgi:hypothetical protein
METFFDSFPRPSRAGDHPNHAMVQHVLLRGFAQHRGLEITQDAHDSLRQRTAPRDAGCKPSPERTFATMVATPRKELSARLAW